MVMMLTFDSIFEADIVVVLLLIISNLAYVLPTWFAWRVRYDEETALLLIETLVSSIHHMCTDGGTCLISAPAWVIAKLDVSLAVVTIGRVLLTGVLYVLIRIKRMRQMVREGGTVAAYNNSDRFVLVKHSFAGFFSTLYAILIIITEFLVDNSFITYGVAAVYIFAVSAFYLIRYWAMFKTTWRRRFRWQPILLSVLLGILSLIFFAFVEANQGRVNHAFWHIGGALAATFYIIGTTANVEL